MLLAFLLRLLPPLPPDSLRVLQWNAGGLRARSTELLHFLLSHFVNLICIQESNLNSSFRIPGFSALRSDRTHSWSGILSFNTTHANGGVIFVRQGLSFSKLSTSTLSSLDPYSDYVGITRCLFSICMPPLLAPPQQMAKLTPFLPPSFPPPEISSFLGTSIAITPSGTQEVPPTPVGRKYSIGSSPLTSSPSMTLTHPPFSIAPLAVALPLTSPLLPPLLLFLAPGRCYRTWVLIIYQFFYLSLSLWSFAPMSVPLPFNFQKAPWNDFASYFDSHCPSAEEYSSISLSSAAALFNSMTLNAAKSSIPFGRIKRPPKAWWSAEVEDAVSERRKAFAAAHRSDEDRQAYITASRRTSSIITKAKTEAWQTTCSSPSPRSNPKSVHSLLCSIAGSPFSSPNFPNCCSPRESALVYAAYLRSHFSISQPKALRSRARGYLSEVRQAMCSEESHSSFCSPFSLAEFLVAASNLSLSSATGPDKVAYPMLKHLARSGMDLLLYIFNLFWSSHSFPSIWKTSSIIPIHKMGKPLDSLASFRPICLTSCVSKLIERIILSHLLFFLESNSILCPRQAGLHLIKFCTFLSPSWMDLTNPGRALGRSCLLSISLKLLTLSGILPFSTNSFWLASLLALLVGLNLFCSIGALVWFIQIAKVMSRCSTRIRSWPCTFLSLLMIFRPLCLLPSAALFTLTIWPFGPPPPWSLLRWRPHKELCFDWSAGLSTGVFLSIQANVRPPSYQWIPIKLTPTQPAFTRLLPLFQSNSNFSWGHLRPHSFLF